MRPFFAIPLIGIAGLACRDRIASSESPAPSIQPPSSALPSTPRPPELRDGSGDSENDIEDVSLLALIARPERFDGRRVRVIGFARLEFEGNALYLHREDLERGITKNAVWIQLDGTRFESDRNDFSDYVIVEGTFDASRSGHMGLFSGQLRQVKRLDRWRVPR